ncbi:VPLPA-CTERM sorting domain-containing protein [Tropicimonas sp. S265A]|uniref:VPLPA-CTERM sorting domain-containing protein n=1 Tax=Tropicimonas sp. S265A TaxID=3415134 RepID=UPI003C7CE076
MLATCLAGTVGHAATCDTGCTPLTIEFSSGPYASTIYNLPAPFAKPGDEIGPYTTGMGASGSVTLDVSGKTGPGAQLFPVLSFGVSDGLFDVTEKMPDVSASAEAAIDEDGNLTFFEVVLGWFGILPTSANGIEVSSVTGTKVGYSTEYFADQSAVSTNPDDECSILDDTCIVSASASTDAPAKVSVKDDPQLKLAGADPLTAVPLPGALPLLVIGLAGFAALRRKA